MVLFLVFFPVPKGRCGLTSALQVHLFTRVQAAPQEVTELLTSSGVTLQKKDQSRKGRGQVRLALAYSLRSPSVAGKAWRQVCMAAAHIEHTVRKQRGMNIPAELPHPLDAWILAHRMVLPI